MSPARITAAAFCLMLLSGCASLAIDDNLAATQEFSNSALGQKIAWLNSEAARQEAQAEVDRLLAQPLAADDALRIALAYSPGFQAALSQSAADSAAATQTARLPNPVFTFEKLVRIDHGQRMLDIGRMLSVSISDLLLLPQRQRVADAQQQALRARMAGEVVQTVAHTRQAWVNAVAARQSEQYAARVLGAAQASTELARRMQAVGNYSRLQRSREQAFYAEAAAAHARAMQSATEQREALVRALGLTADQAARLRLPERLPDLPTAPMPAPDMTQALSQRVDLRMARSELEARAHAHGLTRAQSWIDGLHVGAVHNSETGEPPQRGYEAEFALPIFDFGNARRAGAHAEYMAALYRTADAAVQAQSQIRQSYAAYQSRLDLARHYRDEIVPLKKTISDEMLAKYNGMLIGVFELLADARDQASSVIAAIEAERDFWLADATMQAALLGAPASVQSEAPRSAAPAAAAAH